MNDDDLRRLFEETQRHVDEKAAETQRYVEQKATETQRHVDEKAAETQRHFDVSTEAFQHEVRLLAESVDVKITHLTNRVDQLEEKVDRGFAETQAMIKFSHAELDRRVRALEQSMAELQVRVERLETTTH